ncbi:hypothetical protein [Yersinia bercovieri]|uniref:hypothetical protein n=1 Tax=Yersinia bercovieri TaxID=634 RepID=UPI001643D616|nr:hypothetical protein [Yersinia bercovieri]
MPTKIAGRMSRMDAAKGAVELGASQPRFDKPASCRREWRSHNISRQARVLGRRPAARLG